MLGRLHPARPSTVRGRVRIDVGGNELQNVLASRFVAIEMLQARQNGNEFMATVELQRHAFDGDGLDYVDFNKGMDSCYLRLASPRHTSILTDHFTSHPTAQTRGLDDMGTSPVDTHAALVIEIVQGKKEELYWEKVPEKVRRQAVQKAISELQAKELLLDEDVTMNSNRRKRKRKRDK